MRRQIAAILVGALMVPRLVSGQTLHPGDRVRFSQPSDDTRLLLAQLTALDVSRGKRR